MERLKVGVVGAGRIGKVHCEALSSRVANAEVVAVTDPRREEAEQLASRFAVPLVPGSFEELLETEAMDAVVICSPTDTHRPYVEAAARAGKHIFCEKPLDHDPAVIRHLMDEAERNRVKLMVGYNRRFDPEFSRARRMVASGEVGDIHILRITSRDPEPPPFDYIAVSGGLFLDMAIHDFDMARFITGAEVVEVFARGAVLVDERIGEAGDIDTAVVSLAFDNGALGSIDDSRKASYGYDQRLEVFGSAGMIRVENRLHNQNHLYNSGGIHKALPMDFFMDRYAEAYAIEMAAFVAAVIEDRDVPVTAEDGLRSIEIGLAARKSWLENRPVKIEEIRG